MARVFLINVGANASHPLKSPLYRDNTFELLPIPERAPSAGPPMVRYADLRSYYRPDGDLLAYVPASHRHRYCHHDPEFETCTYGDDPVRAPRAAALRSAREGDWLLFLARLWRWHGERYPQESGFYFVAALQIQHILRDVRRPPSEEALAMFGANAHIRRAQADPSYWNGFWVFKGSPRSRRFQRAIQLTPELAVEVLRDKEGQPWRWRRDRSPLQTIGSYTRTIRSVVDTEAEAFRQWPKGLQSMLRSS